MPVTSTPGFDTRAGRADYGPPLGVTVPYPGARGIPGTADFGASAAVLGRDHSRPAPRGSIPSGEAPRTKRVQPARSPGPDGVGISPYEPARFRAPPVAGVGSAPSGGRSSPRPGSHRTAPEVRPENDGAPRSDGLCCDPLQGLPGEIRSQRVCSTNGWTRLLQCGGPCSPERAVHTRSLNRQVTAHTPHPGLGNDRGQFSWGTGLPGLAPAPRTRCYPAGVPLRLLSGVDGLTARARFLAERNVDGLAVFPPPRPLAAAVGLRG